MKKHLGLFIALGAVLLIGLWLVGAYNSFVRLGEDVETSWAQVENQYQRRFDLIPNLVATVQGIANQEREVFQGVADARSRVGQMQISPELLSDPSAFAQFQAAQGQLGGSLSRLLVAVERYPDLRSSENFLALQSQLEGTENRIAVERRRFNDTVRSYNVRSKGIPGKWLVGLFGFDPSKPLFEADQGAADAPDVSFE